MQFWGVWSAPERPPEPEVVGSTPARHILTIGNVGYILGHLTGAITLLKHKLFAEFLGTFMLVFVGTGAMIVNDVTGGAISNAGIALAFGLTIMAMIYIFGNISGAHINPAVTIGFWVAGRFPLRLVPAYIVSQCAGALIASFLLRIIFPHHATLGTTIPAGSIPHSFILEVTLTIILMFVILNVSVATRNRKIIAAVAIGAIVGLESLFAGPISGASMNPARSLGPAIASLNTEALWNTPFCKEDIICPSRCQNFLYQRVFSTIGPETELYLGSSNRFGSLFYKGHSMPQFPITPNS